MIRIGLRFQASDAAQLRGLAELVRSGQLGPKMDLATFRDAATAAETGEPLIVICEEPVEALTMADGYTRWGVNRPAVEELTGDRPNR